MGRSKTLYQLQQYDSQIDNAKKRIREIDALLADNKLLSAALEIQSTTEQLFLEKKKVLASAEVVVSDHSLKIDQNQKKLYSGTVTNPKDLEDLQLEAASLNKYLSILEERQLEALLEMDEAQIDFTNASSKVAAINLKMETEHSDLISEKTALDGAITEAANRKDDFLSSAEIPDLQTYQSLRKSSGGIAVTLMSSNSCSSCGANIPSAIAQEARSPAKLAFCPTCRRILHPG